MMRHLYNLYRITSYLCITITLNHTYRLFAYFYIYKNYLNMCRNDNLYLVDNWKNTM